MTEQDEAEAVVNGLSADARFTCFNCLTMVHVPQDHRAARCVHCGTEHTLRHDDDPMGYVVDSLGRIWV